MLLVALPQADLGKPSDLIGAARGATDDAIRPTDPHYRFVAVLVVREEQNRLLEGFGFEAEGYGSRDGVVWLSGWITEHGTLTGLTVSAPSPDLAHFESSAPSAARRWRFRPTMFGDCPVATFLSVSVTYTLR